MINLHIVSNSRDGYERTIKDLSRVALRVPSVDLAIEALKRAGVNAAAWYYDTVEYDKELDCIIVKGPHSGITIFTISED